VTLEIPPWSWDPDRLALILETAAAFFESRLEDRHREHLRTRYGLTDETIARYRIGFAPAGYGALVGRLMDAGIEAEEIRASGLVTASPSGLSPLWRGRIMFPYIIGGRPRYFIGRQTDETADRLEGKYIKQKRSILAPGGGRVSNGIEEPIFGADTVRSGAPVVITEGITDAIVTHQAGYAALSPVTVRFKKEHARDLIALCRPAAGLYLIMDNEGSGAGTRGAVAVGVALARAGLRPYLCEIPRPEGIDKVDLNDYVRGGGDPGDLFGTAIDVEEHPIAAEMLREERGRAIERFRSAIIRDRAARSTRPKKGPTGPRLDKAEVLAALPTMAALVGFEGYGTHPVYGSATGQNLSIDGDRWYCFHKGAEGGGGPLEWFAIYEMKIIREGETIPRDRFPEVLEAAADRYIPGWRDRPNFQPPGAL
jgi:hypothetical protein